VYNKGIEMLYGVNHNENLSDEKLNGCSFYEKEESVTLEDGYLTAKQQLCKADSISPSETSASSEFPEYYNADYFSDLQKLANVLPPKIIGEMKKLKLDDIIEVVLDIVRCG